MISWIKKLFEPNIKITRVKRTYECGKLKEEVIETNVTIPPDHFDIHFKKMDEVFQKMDDAFNAFKIWKI